MQNNSFQFFSPLKTPTIRESKKMAKSKNSNKDRKISKKDKRKLTERIPSSNPGSDASDVDVNHDILSMASNISQNFSQSIDSSDVSDMDISLPIATSTQNNTPFTIPGRSPTKYLGTIMEGASPLFSKDAKKKRGRSDSESSIVSGPISPKKKVRLSVIEVKKEQPSSGSDSEESDTSESNSQDKANNSHHDISNSDSDSDEETQVHMVKPHKSPPKAKRISRTSGINYNEGIKGEPEDEESDNIKSKISQKINLRSSFPKGMNALGFHSNSLWLEDLQEGNKELWMLRVPRDFDIDNLNGKSALLEGSIFLDKERNENKKNSSMYSWELHAMRNKEKKESSSCLLLPSKKTKTLKNAGSLDGQMWISKSLTTEPYIIPQSKREKPQIPTDLKMRNIPFGSGIPQSLNGAKRRSKTPKELQKQEDSYAEEEFMTESRSSSKKPKKHKRQKEGKCRDESDSSVLTEVTPKVQKNEKDRNANDVDTTPKSHKKHKKDKRKSVELPITNIESSSGESSHKSHKKHKNFESFQVDPMEETVRHKKHKKDKKKNIILN